MKSGPGPGGQGSGGSPPGLHSAPTSPMGPSGGGGTNQGGLTFSLFVPAHFGTLDERAKFHQVMRCCPSCGAPLVLFREKFGEVPGRSPPGASHPLPGGGKASGAGKAPGGGNAPGGGKVSGVGGVSGSDSSFLGKGGGLLTSGITGGWVCTKCGVHIVPNTRPQSTPTSPDNLHAGRGGNSPGTGFQKGSSTPSSREVSPRRPGGASHQGPGHNTSDNNATCPLSPKPPVIIDDDYEIWERQVKTSFTSFLNQIRERLGHKEISLKQYQVTLCQRERQLRNNEENMQQRWGKMQQNEQNFKTKMDRLHLYKDTMIHQLEAKARQLSQYEQRLRNSDFRASTHDIHSSTQDLKNPIMDFRITTPPDEKQNTSITSTRSPDIKNISNDLWNTSTTSEGLNATLNGQHSANSPRTLKNIDGRAGPLGDNRPKVAVTMVKPTVVEYRKPQTSGPSENRGSQSALARDFRPNGASSANINQIYTRDNSAGYQWSKQQPPAHQPRSGIPQKPYPDSSNYLYRKPQVQKPLSPTHSRNGSAYDVRQAYFPNKPQKDPSSLKPSAPIIRHSASDDRPSGTAVRQLGSDNRHPGSEVRHSSSEVSKLGNDTRYSNIDVRHSAPEFSHKGSDIRRLGSDGRPNQAGRHLGSDIKNAVPDRQPVSEVRHLESQGARHTAPIRTALPPQQKPTMPLKSALKSTDSSATQRWTTQTNLHVSTVDRADPSGGHRSNVVTSYVEHDNISLSPSERERSVSGLSDLSPTYTTSGYASDRENSMNGGVGTGAKRVEKEKHNVSFEDMIDTSSPQGTVERDTRPPWMKRRSRRLTEV